MGVSVIIKNISKVIFESELVATTSSLVTIEELSPYLGTSQVSQERSPEYKLKPLG